MIADPVFWLALRNTVVWTVGAIAGELALGLVVALLLNKELPGHRVAAVLSCCPGSCPTWWPATCGR